MKNKFYEEFYFMKDEVNHYLWEVQKEYQLKSGDISKFKGFMRCPECWKAELSFTHKTFNKSEYLSKIPTSNHKEYCSYINEYATKKQIQKFVKTLNEKQVHDRLESALNMLLRTKKIEFDDLNKMESKEKKNPFVIKCDDKPTVRRTIPRKSLNMWFDKEYNGEIFIFYGRVKLKIQTKMSEGKEYYSLIIRTKKSNGVWDYKTQVFRGVLKDEIDEDREYDIAILGELTFWNEKHPQIRLEKKNYILYR